mmetsp:Transcript_19272/g.28073  ORF Transcript_19272/g.28073 Transcript_19272/m.28073 type:complete len:294 (+) Transcript_19272:74-955(+)
MPLFLAPCHSSLMFVPIPTPTKPSANHQVFMVMIARCRASASAVPSMKGSSTERTVEHRRYPRTNFGNLSQRNIQLNAFVSSFGPRSCQMNATAVARIPRPEFRTILTIAATSVASSLIIAADAITLPVWSTDPPIHAPAIRSFIPTPRARYGWANVKKMVKNATTEIEREMSLPGASMTLPIALMADAPHHVAPVAMRRARPVSILRTWLAKTKPRTRAIGDPTQATTRLPTPTSPRMPKGVARSANEHLIKNSPSFATILREDNRSPDASGEFVISMPKIMENMAYPKPLR